NLTYYFSYHLYCCLHIDNGAYNIFSRSPLNQSEIPNYLNMVGNHKEKVGMNAINNATITKMIKNGILSLINSSIFVPVMEAVVYIIVPSGGVKVPILIHIIKKIQKWIRYISSFLCIYSNTE